VVNPKTKAGDVFDQFAEELLRERNARPLIIVGAAKVDGLLLEIVGGFLLPKRANGNQNDELLEGDTPLATFSARIKICHRLGLIDVTLCRTLDHLRIIRNLCAHSISFDHAKPPVRDRLTELRNLLGNRRSYRLTKERYFDAPTLEGIEEIQCLLLTMCVLLEAIREKVGRTSGHKKALSISSK
jgi:hypothetical protein